MKNRSLVAVALLVAGAAIFYLGARDYATWTRPSVTASFSFHPAAGATPRPLPALSLEPDSYYWLAYADTVASGDAWRIRWTQLDNPPHGRPVYWSSPLVWSIHAVRSTLERIGGQTPARARDISATATPALWWLLFAGLAAPLLLRVAGGPGLVAGLAGLLFLPGLQRDFGVLRLDHHGLLTGALVIAVAGLTASTPGRRTGLALSALAGAVGLWIQAPVAALVLNATGLGAAFCIWALLNPRDLPTVRPADDWQWWGRTGAVLSLLFYAIEYVPGHVGMRLEANHPLYALNWWALGEGLAWLARRETSPAPFARSGWWWTAGLLALPAALWFGPVEWFLFRDAFLARVHGLIEEFAPMRAVFSSSGWTGLLLALGPGIVALPVALVLLARTRLAPALTLALTLAVAAAGAATTLAWQHNRFLGLANALLTGLLVVLLTAVPAGRRRWAAALLAALLAFTPTFLNQRTLSRQQAAGTWRAGLAPRVQLRDLALRLQQLVPEADRTALAGFDESPYLNHFGGFRTTGGLYWENREGLRDTVLFFTSTEDSRALALLQQRQLRYVVMEASPEAMARFYFSRHGQLSEEGIRQTLAYRLATGQQLPAWLEPLPLGLTPAPGTPSYVAYRVVAPASSR
jgi:hypothetical protein